MLKYQPRGALSPKLAKVMAKLFKIIQENDLMASLTISDGGKAEFFCGLDPDWSCCKANKLPDGSVDIRVRSKRADYRTAAEQKEHIERTISGLANLFQNLEIQRGNLIRLMAEVKRAVSFSHYGEEFKGHTSEPPDPDKVPTTLEEAADLIFATLDEDQLAWVKATPLHEAMPQLHHGFGTQLRNSWSLWEDTPLRRHVQETYKLFGHADDLSALIFTWLWAKVRGGNPVQDVDLEVVGMRQHWHKHGVNPETGEKGIILP